MSTSPRNDSSYPRGKDLKNTKIGYRLRNDPEVLGKWKTWGEAMAFTDVEVQEAREAVCSQADAADLFRLGLIYSTDHQDSGPNYIEAHKWFSLAAMMGNDAAKSYCMELKHEMSREDLTLAQRAARGWMLENRTQTETKVAA